MSRNTEQAILRPYLVEVFSLLAVFVLSVSRERSEHDDAALPSAREWLQLQANRHLSPRTIEAYGRGLEDLLRFCEQQAPPLSVETATKGDLAAYVQDLVTRPNPHGQQIIHLHSGHGLSDQTIQLRLTAARLSYDHLVAIVQRTRNPVGRGKYTRRTSFSGVRHPTPADERPLVRRKPAPHHT